MDERDRDTDMCKYPSSELPHDSSVEREWQAHGARSHCKLLDTNTPLRSPILTHVLVQLLTFDKTFEKNRFRDFSQRHTLVQ